MTRPGRTDPDVVVTTSGPVATLWLNRPQKRNAVTADMWASIAEACRELADDDTVRALVVRGVGDHFCAGADVGGLGATPGYGAINAEAEAQLAAFPKPTVALTVGACVGGGVQIASACDLRIADETALLGVTPARLGIVYPASAIERLHRLVGPAAAKHLLFTAELINAERALRIGLVDEVVAAGQAESRVDTLVHLMTEERSLLTQMASKQMVDDIATHGRVADLTTERWRRHLADNPDSPEGIAAFAERRRPRSTWTPSSRTAR
ncbi:MAG: enoyl-CoA hydratase/isomerase family protein [Acidimicrobiia bacterium]|nr:enoyl-CoA hydratase/isomerase family protein [Acidimicrobiia bacterium]